MKTKLFLIYIFGLISLNAYAVDQEYLNQLKKEIIGINLKLPKKIDDITTMEEMRIINLEDGYYVSTMAKIDSNTQSLGNNRDIVRKNTIKIGCNDPKTLLISNELQPPPESSAASAARTALRPPAVVGAAS